MSLPFRLVPVVILLGCFVSGVNAQDDWNSLLGENPQIVPTTDNSSVIRPARNSGLRRNLQDINQDLNIEAVMRELDQDAAAEPAQPVNVNDDWWTRYVTQLVDANAQPLQVNVGDLILMAIEYSAKVNVARALPRIRETAIVGSEAAFDWNNFIDSQWRDTSEPVGNDLTIGPTGGTRFREHNYSIDLGLRRKLFNGADVYTYQRLGHLNNNSAFFNPQDQATSRIVLGFTQPLLRGRGVAYNTSLILLAEIDTGSASDEFHRQLQTHLLEVARGYWALYLERTNLAQRVSLYLNTKSIAEELNSRAAIDAQQTQVISANAALAARKSDLIRTRAAVKNAETRLRALINSPYLDGDADLLEMIPVEHPVTLEYPADKSVEFETALMNRPEIAAAMKAIRASCVRLQMADHEVLPTLNVLTEAYVAGLRGDSNISDAWVDQFRAGEPGYSIGLQWEVPLGRRAARSNQRRRQLEVRQLEEQYRATLELVRAEVEVAVRELQTTFQELEAKNRSRMAAYAEAASLKARWEELGADQGTAGSLTLEALLRAQERVTLAEFEYAKAQMTYSLALINLRHANGTLYQTAGMSGMPTVPMSAPMGEPTPAMPPQEAPPEPSKKVPEGIIRQTPEITTQRTLPLQQANANWNRPADFKGIWDHDVMKKSPETRAGYNDPIGVTYNEMIGKPRAHEANLKEDDWRRRIR